jgi:hypothetical protein
MRRVGVWALGAALLVALAGVTAKAAEDDDEEEAKPAAQSTGWNPFGKWFGSDEKKADKAKKDGKKKPGAEKEAEPTPRSLRREAAEKTWAEEEAKLHRRQAVCLRLLQVAKDTNDADLEQMATQLDERAWQLFRERTDHLPAGAAPLESDEARLEKRLPVRGAGAARLATPAGRASGDYGSTGAVREVEP